MSRRHLVWLLALLSLLSPVHAREKLTDRLRFWVQWDDSYLYFAARSDDLDVVGRHGGLNEPVWLDDDVELFVRTDKKAPEALDDQCFWLGMSAAGGVYFAQGPSRGQGDWLPQSPMVPGSAKFRQSTKVHGTLNDSSDADQGWSLETALPWAALGLQKPPKTGDFWRFNVVRHLRGETDLRFSYLFEATPLVGQMRPKLWGTMVFRGEDGEASGWVEPGDGNAVICPRARTARTGDKRLVIDGEIKDGEWPELYRIDVEMTPQLSLGLPHEDYPPPAEDTVPPPAGSDWPRQPVKDRPRPDTYSGERLVLATYYLDYQDDPRLPGIPTLGVRGDDGTVKLGSQPLAGVGPWFSSLRAGWHAAGLAAAARAHINALLVWYPGDAGSRRRWADAALRTLSVAAYEMRQQRQPAPGLGVVIPLSALRAEVGAEPNLVQQETQESLYRMIRDFYRTLSPEAWAIVADGGQQTVLVALDQPTRETRFTRSFMAYCQQRFAEDFGLGLTWLGSTGWIRRGAPLDGVIAFDAGQEPLSIDSTRIRVASVGPGYNDQRVNPHPLVRSRQGIGTLRSDFRKVMLQPRNWLFLQSWNGFRNGDQLAASREFGRAHEQAAQVLALQFDAPEEGPWVAKLERVETPLRIGSGMRLDTLVRVANAGMRAWDFTDGVQLSYHLLTADPVPVLNPDGTPRTERDGRPMRRPVVVTERGSRSAVLTPLGNAAVETVVAVEARDSSGQPLPPGRYRLRFDAHAEQVERYVQVRDARGRLMVNRKREPIMRREVSPNWLSALGDPTFDIQLEVVAPEELPTTAGTVVGSDLPPRVERGQRYPVSLQVRNEGNRPWDESIRLAARFELLHTGAYGRREPAPEAASDWIDLGGVLQLVRRHARETAKALGQDPKSAPVKETVAPGELLAVPASLPIVGRGLSALPMLRPGDGTYRLVWALLDGQRQPLPARSAYQPTVDVVERDWGAAFGRIDCPTEMRGSTTSPCTVQVANTGFRTWPRQQTQLAWHWYFWDGVEAHFDAGRLPLPTDLPPGKRTELPVNITAPAYPGPYYLVFDVVHPGGIWNSQQPCTSARDKVPRPVAVVAGAARPVDLAALLNVVGAGFDGDTKTADFDGAGNSLPAELLPPGADDVTGGIYPSGYLGAAGVATPSWQRRIAFRYVSARKKATALRADRQLVKLTPGRYRRLHVLCAGAGEDVSCQFAVVPAAGGEPRALPPVTVTNWTQPPGHGELLGLQVGYCRAAGDKAADGARYLHHVVLAVDPELPIASLLLPEAPLLRIVAITAEAAPANPVVGPPAP